MIRLLLLALVAAPAAFAQTQTLADVPVGASGMGGPGEGPFTLVSLRENRVVPNADSASAAWDLGFRGTTVIVNGGVSGPGQGRAAVLDVPFTEVEAVPADSLFRADGEGACPRGAALAVCGGSRTGWYVYTGNEIVPVAGRTVVVQAADGTHAHRVRVVSYYRGAPDAETGVVPAGSEPRFYTLEHAPLPARR